MTKKEKTAKLVRDFIEVFRCPLCKESMQVVDLKSIVCPKRHTFDFAKQGYVNLMSRPSKSQYNKELFDARQKIITESNLFTSLHQQISQLIKEYIDVSNDPVVVLDAGCGEGSHLQRILEECKNKKITGVGLDVAKEGILMAAKKYEDPIWVVGDLANSPLADQSFHVILNILSPSNYKEFKRIIVQDGVVIKVVPGSNYLKELRGTVFDQTEKKNYKNNKTVSLFKKHFHEVKVTNLNETMNVNKKEIINLIQMTPLTWNLNKTELDMFTRETSSRITVDLDILVGVNQ